MRFNLLAILLVLIVACTEQKPGIQETVQQTLQTCSGNYAVIYEGRDSLSLNPKKQYHAASTMKIPVMIEVFKQVALGTINLDDSIIIRNEFKSIVDSSLYSLSPEDDSDQEIYAMTGKPMSIYDLTDRMITISSNLATNILIELVNAQAVTQSMRELGAMDIEVLRGVEDIKAYRQGLSNSTTAHDLYIILDAILNGKAGTKEHCEMMLEILKRQEYNEIIPAKLPKNVSVAHKTGVITALHHDAGIVFPPDQQPYILVLLSEELEDFDRCTDMLATVSQQIYGHEQALQAQ